MIQLCAFADEAAEGLADQIRALKKNDIHWIELRFIDGISIADLGEEDAQRVKQALDAAGIRVWSLGSPYGKVRLGDGFDPAALFGQLRHLCVLARIFRTDRIRIFSFYNAYDKRDEVIRLLGESVGIAAEYGITLYHENEKEIYGDTVGRVLDLYHHVPGLHLVERHGVGHRQAAQVHERLGLDEHQFFPAQERFADDRLEFQLFDGRIQLRGDDADHVKARVVPGMLVFFARVAQAHDRFHGAPFG